VITISTYQTGARISFDSPATSNIGTLNITLPYIISGQWSCGGSFQGPLSQLTLGTATFESPLWCELRVWLWCNGKTLCKMPLFKKNTTANNKSEHLLDFDVHLRAGYFPLHPDHWTQDDCHSHLHTALYSITAMLQSLSKGQLVCFNQLLLSWS